MATNHKSSCAVCNMPAFPAGPCDCGAEALDAAYALTPELQFELATKVAANVGYELVSGG